MLEVAVYKGDTMLACGTLEECAKELGIKTGTVYYYLMPAHKRRTSLYKNPSNARIAVRLDDDDDDQQCTAEVGP